MTIGGHARQTPDKGIHSAVAWVFDDAPNRASFTPTLGIPVKQAALTAADLYKLAFQVDTKKLYILTAIGPPVWQEVDDANPTTTLVTVLNDHFSASWSASQLGTHFQEFKSGVNTTIDNVDGENDHPGVVKFVVDRLLGTNFASATMGLQLGGGIVTLGGSKTIVYEAWIKLKNDISNGLNRAQWGFSDGNMNHFAEADNCALIEYKPGTNANFRLRTRSASGTPSYSNLGVAPSDDVWTFLRITYDGADITGYVDVGGTTGEATQVSTSIAAAMQPGARHVGSGDLGSPLTEIYLDRISVLSSN